MTTELFTIWTVGHATLTIEEFIDVLREHQIEILVDVRHLPGSRKIPPFGKIALHDALVADGIGYEDVFELGGRRPVHRDSHNAAWRNASFRGYADHMETGRSALTLIAYWRSPSLVEPRSCVPKRSGGAATVR
jgi:uncharacterized protein (DUF488 family)